MPKGALYLHVKWLCNPEDNPVEIYMSCVWFKAEREHIKVSHGSRKSRNTEDGSKWKSELEIAWSKLANKVKYCFFKAVGHTGYICVYVHISNTPGNIRHLWAFFQAARCYNELLIYKPDGYMECVIYNDKENACKLLHHKQNRQCFF